MGKIIGIDLGTLNSASPSWKRPAEESHQSSPRRAHDAFIIACSDDGEILSGAGQAPGGRNPKNTLYAVEAPDRPPLPKGSAEGHR